MSDKITLPEGRIIMLTNSSDLNNCTQNNVTYCVPPNVFPANNPTSMDNLLIQVYKAGSTTVQIVFRAYNENIWVRTAYYSDWNDWKTLAFK